MRLSFICTMHCCEPKEKDYTKNSSIHKIYARHHGANYVHMTPSGKQCTLLDEIEIFERLHNITARY